MAPGPSRRASDAQTVPYKPISRVLAATGMLALLLHRADDRRGRRNQAADLIAASRLVNAESITRASSASARASR